MNWILVFCTPLVWPSSWTHSCWVCCVLVTESSCWSADYTEATVCQGSRANQLTGGRSRSNQTHGSHRSARCYLHWSAVMWLVLIITGLEICWNVPWIRRWHMDAWTPCFWRVEDRPRHFFTWHSALSTVKCMCLQVKSINTCYEWYWQNLIENYSISQRCKPDKMDRMKYLPS